MRVMLPSAGLVLLLVTSAAAQDKAQAGGGASPIVNSIKTSYTSLKNNLTKSAEMVPDAKYTFKPSGVAPEVRSFGQLIGHIANVNSSWCGGISGLQVTGELGPGGVDYEKITTKAGLQKALADSFAVCDKAFADVNDRNGATVTQLPMGSTTKIGGLAANNVHLAEHYGNIVTYLRAMGMVPPSSQPSR
jgi:uncharacterized damage-inducible protein DinB